MLFGTTSLKAQNNTIMLELGGAWHLATPGYIYAVLLGLH